MQTYFGFWGWAELLINIRNGMAAIFFHFKEKKEKESKNRKWCVTISEIKSTSPE